MTKALIRSMNRRGSRSDKSPPVAHKQKFSDPSICDRCGAVYSGKSWRRGRRVAPDVMNRARWVECPGSRTWNGVRCSPSLNDVSSQATGTVILSKC